MTKNLTLRQQIGLAASLLIFLVMLASGLGLWYGGTATRSVEITQESVQRVNELAELERTWAGIAATIDRMLLTRQTALHADLVRADLETFNEQLNDLQAWELGAQTQAMADSEGIISEMQFFGDELTGLSNEILALTQQQRWAEAQVLRHTEMTTLQRRFDERLAQLTSGTQQAVGDVVEATTRRQATLGTILAAGLLLAMVVGVSVTYYSVGAITQPINQLIEQTRQVTEGDFSYVPPLDRNDELGTLSEAFSMMTEWLAESYQVLEERVAERTRDMVLAAEVGRRLTRVRDLDALLQQAVDLIDERFDLYYTQVYLTSDDERTLLLRAGTGEVGQELLRRGFSLPLNRNSINGTAAVERHAVVISDTSWSGRFRPNPLLPDTSAEIAIPLLAGERVVGVLDLQSDRRYGLTEDDLAAFEVLAGQLAIAIENAQLFAEAQAAREVLENRAQQRVGENWQAFLDAINREEHVGYRFAGDSVSRAQTPWSGSEPYENTLNVPIKLNEQHIGGIHLLADPAEHWSEDRLELVDAVARQVAQQVENLRLLAEADRYRQEAEDALRRLTREGWEAFYQSGETGEGAYVYDGRVVQPLDNGEHDPAIVRSLTVREEPVGELLVDVPQAKMRDDAADLVSAVAARLSAHLENLRLAQQTESALVDVQRRSQELEHLNRVVTRIASTLDLRDSLQVVVDELVDVTSADQARIGLLNEAQTELTIVSECFDETRSPSAMDLVIPVEGNELTEEVLATRRPVVIREAQTHPRTKPIRQMIHEQGIQTMVIMPILAGNEVIGTVGADILEEDAYFGEEDLRLAETVVFQAATAIQNARLFEQVQRALAETRTLYRASAELNKALTFDDILDVIRQYSVAGEGSNSVSLALFDEPWTDSSQPEWTEVRAFWSPDPPDQPSLRYRLAEFPSLTKLRRDRHTLIEDVETDPGLDERSRRLLLRGFHARTVLAVPLLVGGQWIGHVNVMYPQVRGISDGDLQQLSTLTAQAAVAVQSIVLLEETNRLLESEQRQRRISDALVGATERMLGVMDERQIRRVLIEEVENLIRPGQLSLYTLQPQEDALRVEFRKVASRSHDADDYSLGQTIGRQQRPDLWQVLQDGEPSLRRERQEDDSLREQYMAPWMVGDTVAGVLEVYDGSHGRTIRDEDRASVEGIIQQAAIRLQSARLFEEAELRAEELAILNEMGRALTTLFDVPTVLETVYGFSSRLVDTSNFYVALHDAERERVSFPIFVQDGERVAEPTRPLEEDLIKFVIDEREPLLLPQDGQAQELSAELAGLGTTVPASWLGVPMLFGDEVIGVIVVQNEQVYDEHDQDLLSAVASSAAIAVQNTRLFEETQRRAAQTEELYRASRRINTAENYDEILASLREHTLLGESSQDVSLNYFERAWTEQEAPERVHVLARWSELPPDTVSSRYDLAQFSGGPDLLSPQEATLVTDVANDPRLDDASRVFLQDLGAASTIFVPLVVGGQWLGFINAVYGETVEFADAEVRRLMALTRQAATALHGLRLLEQAQSRAERERVLREITARVRSATDVDVIMKTAVREVSRALGRNAFVKLGEENGDDGQSEATAMKESG